MKSVKSFTGLHHIHAQREMARGGPPAGVAGVGFSPAGPVKQGKNKQRKGAGKGHSRDTEGQSQQDKARLLAQIQRMADVNTRILERERAQLLAMEIQVW